MNKSKSQFASLSDQDRRHILDLCARYPYDEVVAILAKPRPEGLGILTSTSTVCRFFTTTHADPAQLLLTQTAAVAQIQHEQNSNSFLAAIRASVEARVYENLLRGKALLDMERDFRLLKTVESIYLADAKWRADNPKAARAAYQGLVDRCAASSSDADFTTVGESAEALEINLSQFEEDVAASRRKRQTDAAQKQFFLETLQSGRHASPTRPADAERLPVEHPFPHQNRPPATPETPAIPHIPPNSTSPTTSAKSAPTIDASTSAPPSPAPSGIKPAPFVRPESKVERNARCPCGSKLKFKKCCLLKQTLPLAA